MSRNSSSSSGIPDQVVQQVCSRQVRLLIKGHSCTKADYLLRMSRVNMNIATGLLTSHVHLYKHLIILLDLGKICRYYYENEETSVHVLCEYTSTMMKRHRHLGAALFIPKGILETQKEAILSFAAQKSLLTLEYLPLKCPGPQLRHWLFFFKI